MFLFFFFNYHFSFLSWSRKGGTGEAECPNIKVALGSKVFIEITQKK